MSHLKSDLRPLGEGAFVGFSVREKEGGGDCSTLQKYNHAAGFTCLQLFYSHLSAHLKKKKSYVLSVLQSQVTVH